MAGVVRCPNGACANVVVVAADDGAGGPPRRERFVWSCGTPPFCTRCRQPWHAHGECDEVGAHRARWLAWVERGRAEYHGADAAYHRLRDQQAAALRDALARQREEERDEQWKAEHCRCCPRCGRPAQHMGGCALMVCGRNYHGGDQQDGCGASWNWESAPRYRARVAARNMPAVDAAREAATGADVRHFFVSCGACGARNIRGPRFRCLHCDALSICVGCDRRAALAPGGLRVLGGVPSGGARAAPTTTHPADHVFEIILEPEQRFSIDIPIGARVRLVGLSGRQLGKDRVEEHRRVKHPNDVLDRHPHARREREQPAARVLVARVEPAVFAARQRANE